MILTLISALLAALIIGVVGCMQRLEHIAKTLDRIDERGGVL